MNRTYTPELAPEVLDRLGANADRFHGDFNRPRQAQYSGVYIQGLLLDGERKSIEPLSRRVTLPDGLAVKDLDQALQQFIGQSTWDDQAVRERYRSVMAATFADPEAIFVIDDTSFPKQGKLSVGVQGQYCGASGKEANCQVAPSVHYVSPKGHHPPAMRLYVPESWAGDADRLERAGVPDEHRKVATKGQVALELLDRVRGEGLPGQLVVADAGYGTSGPFREGLAGRGLRYIVGVTGEMVVFTEGPTWEAPPARPPGTGGRPATRSKLAESSPRPGQLEGSGDGGDARQGDLAGGDQGEVVGSIRLATGLAWIGVGRRRVRRSRADLAADRGAGRWPDQARRVQPAEADQSNRCGTPVEESLAGGTGLSADEGGVGAGPPRRPVMARLSSPRLPGDAGVRVLSIGARAGRKRPDPSGKKEAIRPPITPPAIRRALQRMLAPLCGHDCPYCRRDFFALKKMLTE